MTFAPTQPKYTVDDSTGIATLIESHITFVKFPLGYSLMVHLKPGFKFDGASVPKEDLEDSRVVKRICKFIAKHYPDKDYKETLNYLIGTPFEMPRLIAAIVHDALYGMKWKIRWLCDRVYRRILIDLGYDRVRLEIEYGGIRLLGGKNWDAVTKEEKKNTRKLSDVKILRVDEVWKEKIKLLTYKMRAGEPNPLGLG